MEVNNLYTYLEPLVYNLSILAMFKNESLIIIEWIEHYLKEGVQHFYLIDNGSNDDYEKKIKNYMKYITLIKDPIRLKKGTQTYLYNKLFLDIIKKETKWIIICDIDEYIYSRNKYNNIIDVLDELHENIHKIWLPWKIFGSNGHKLQPNNIIKSFTKRKKDFINNQGYGKCIVKTKNLIKILENGHYCYLNNNNIYYNSNGNILNNFNFNEESSKKLNLHLNHYMMMSEEYYFNIKCKRGGGGSGFCYKYTKEYFYKYNENYNIIDDIELSNKTTLNILDDFEPNIYKLLNKDLSNMNNEELKNHYINFGFKENRIYKIIIPNDFEPNIYKLLNKDLSNMNNEELKNHYINFGFKENRMYKVILPNNFEPNTYKLLNADLSNMNNKELKNHYINFGFKENRIYKIILPNDFEPNIYKLLNKDLSNMNNAELKNHYINFGFKEDRKYKI